MSIATDIQSIGFLTDLRESALVYPVVMATHLACIALFGGMVVLTDLRLLGVALTDIPVSAVVNGLRPWKRLGFVIIATCGLLLGGSEAEKYAPNPYFWTKMTLLALVGIHALIFKPQVYNHPEVFDNLKIMPSRAKAAAAISLVLWLSIPTMGRLIAYWEGPRPTGPASAQTQNQ